MMEGSPAPTGAEKYKDRKVIVEVGGQLQSSSLDTSLLNQLSIPDSENPLYIGINNHTQYLDTVPSESAPSAAMMVADIRDPDFLEHFDELDGQVDRLFMLNVLTDYPERWGNVDALYYKLLLTKTAHMLKPGAKAYLSEWYTPSMMGGLEHTNPVPELLDAKLITKTSEILETLRAEGVSEEKLSNVEFFLNRAPYVDETPAFLLQLTKK